MIEHRFAYTYNIDLLSHKHQFCPNNDFIPRRPPEVFGSMAGGTTFGGPWRGSRRSGRYSGIRAQGSNEICNKLLTMAVPKKGTRALLARPCVVLLGSECVAAIAGRASFERVCWFALAEFGFVLGLYVSRLCWWDFVCPQDRKVCFVSRTLRALPDGSLVSTVGVWLAVPLVGVLALRCCFPYFSWVAWGGGAFTWPLVPCRASWRPLWRRSLPLNCFEVEQRLWAITGCGSRQSATVAGVAQVAPEVLVLLVAQL
ncbi:hypothetical protein Taro_050140 [Colocasia esculenta]|uniref:Uncharacterized protein n=1 Tax=Colocasia esculenta TaxID=4460 RepID=A0A843XD00_COLES|nr:hypothetical protein [Colocasia esculenta]